MTELERLIARAAGEIDRLRHVNAALLGALLEIASARHCEDDKVALDEVYRITARALAKAGAA